jgi:hypothetical protein
VDDFSNEIGSDIGGLGVDTAADTSKHGNDGSAESVSGQRLGQVNPFFGVGVMGTEDEHG